MEDYVRIPDLDIDDLREEYVATKVELKLYKENEIKMINQLIRWLEAHGHTSEEVMDCIKAVKKRG